MDLGGTWRAIEADDALRRSYPEPDFDDSGWAEVAVPGHWRSSTALADADGPVLYRRRFETSGPHEDRRAWLTFEGLVYQGDVWLDGSYLGDTEGYFFPHTFEVTDALRDRAEHVLALELTCAPQRDRTAKRNVTGLLQPGDGSDPGWNPGGIWRPVHLSESGPVRMSRLRTLVADATPERAIVQFRAVLDAAEAQTVCIATTIGATDHHLEQPLGAGENRVLWTVTVERPDLWWPHGLGEQPLHDVAVEVSLPDLGNQVSDRRGFRTGLRRVRMRNWLFSVNGERLYLKGSDQGPTRIRLAEATAEETERHVVLARDEGLDLLRVRAHIGRPELYDAADRHGLLLWQDLPLHGGYARGIRKQVVRQAREAVDLLGHHPSVAIWCGHSAPPPSNRAILDAAVKRALEKADGTRPTLAHPPVGVSFGSGRGPERDLSRLFAVWPRMARFVTGFRPATGSETSPAAKVRAERLRHEVEHLRRLKYRPTGGFSLSSSADGDPEDTWSVLDREALATACAPVIVAADRPAAAYQAGDAVALDVHVVSDLRLPVEGARVTATLRWEGGSASWSWKGDVAADACVRVGMVQAVVPDAPGPLVLDLTLDADQAKAANRYESLITRS
jgi:beta-mannosidase